MPDHQVVQVDVVLRHARGEHAAGALPRDAQRAARALPAAHRKNHGPRLPVQQPRAGNRRDGPVRRHREHGRARHIRDAQLLHLRDEALGVFRAGKRLAEARHAEAVVDALAQDAAELRFPLHDQKIAAAVLPQAHGGRKARGPAAHDQNADFLLCHVRTLPVNTRLPVRL